MWLTEAKPGGVVALQVVLPTALSFLRITCILCSSLVYITSALFLKC